MDNEFDIAIDDIMKKAERAVETAVNIIEVSTKMLAPVDTGTLRRSYTSKVESNDDKVTGTVGSNVEYAYWVDQKQPHLTKAIDQNLETIKLKMKEILTPTKG